MNILIPHNWLLDHLETKATPEEIQKYLSLCGPSVERIEQIEGEPVYDIEVTTNRVDSMCIRGIAREAATILSEFDIPATLKPLEFDTHIHPDPLPELDIKIVNHPELCHRIMAIKISDIILGPSPKWLQQRLIQVGQRPINNAIDITNYVMWDLGHPVHVFDYDRLTEKKIIVREGVKGEILVGLDNKSYSLNGGEVIFDDGTGNIIDLPGIMGTKNTVVTDSTKNILLFIDSINASKIRHASMSLSIRSQAAILNEKGVDPNLALDAIKQGIKLILTNANGHVSSQLYDHYPSPAVTQPISVNQAIIDTYMGIAIKPERITRILSKLDFNVEQITNNSQISYQITPPSFRINDVVFAPDIIEEIARIYGYHNLDSTIMDGTIPDNPDKYNYQIEYQIKQWLSGWGCQEIYSYSLVSKKLVQQSEYEESQHLNIINPLTDDLVFLRRSLIPSLIQILIDNPSFKGILFELQNVYHPSPETDQLPQETMTLALTSNQSYSLLKGILDSLFKKLYILKFDIKPQSNSNQADIVIDDKKVGNIGRQQINDQYYYGFEIDLYMLISYASSHPKTLPLNLMAPLIEDYTFAIPQKTLIGPVIDTIKKTSKLIESVSLKDVYHPQSSYEESDTSNNQKSNIQDLTSNYTFTITYRHPNRPLTDTEIAPIRAQIVANLENYHQTKLIGELL